MDKGYRFKAQEAKHTLTTEIHLDKIVVVSLAVTLPADTVRCGRSKRDMGEKKSETKRTADVLKEEEEKEEEEKEEEEEEKKKKKFKQEAFLIKRHKTTKRISCGSPFQATNKNIIQVS